VIVPVGVAKEEQKKIFAPREKNLFCGFCLAAE
jgi:hypothetical protein